MPVKGYFIPFEKSLHSLLEMPEMQSFMCTNNESDNLLFVVWKYSIDDFNLHNNSYTVKVTDNMTIVLQSSLVIPWPALAFRTNQPNEFEVVPLSIPDIDEIA